MKILGRCGGGGGSGKMGEQQENLRRRTEGVLMGYDKAGGWEDHGHTDAFFPRTKRAVMQSTRRSLIQPKEQSLQQGLDALRKEGSIWSLS